MAIINVNGFDFFTDINGNPMSLIIRGNNLSEEISFIKDNKIQSLSLNFFQSKNVLDLNFLQDVNFVEKISLDDLDINYSGLYYLKNLKNLTLSVKNSTQHLDFSKFVDLESLFVDWYQKFPDLTQCNNLKELHLWKFKPKTKSFSELVLPKNLEVLSITQSNIQSLRELCLPNLKDFGAYYCNSLDNTEGINKFSENLQTLIFQYSRKLVNYNDLKFCKKLEKLIIADCGNIPNLNWLTELKNIKHFSFWNTTLNDGNVKPCFGIDYVSFKDSKHYNFKESDFVKKT